MKHVDVELTNPAWEPLLMHVAPDKIDDWMWMSRVRVGRRVIEQYKHRVTRDYVCLDTTGRGWRPRRTWRGGRRRFTRVRALTAIASASGGW